jgi:hypothetical protein
MKERLGSTVKTGEIFFQIAPLDDIVVVAKVDERDITLVRRAFDKGEGTGEVATKAKPEAPVPFRVERIVPLSVPGEGKNVFEVRGRLEGPLDWFKPGIEGVAKFNTEKRTLLWIGTRRIVDQVRLWLWW